MKLAISNIGWAADPLDSSVLAVLRGHGVAGIDVAPTRLWPHWEGATESSARAWARRHADAGFVIPAAQSLLYQTSGLALFGDATGLIDHLRRVADLVAALGAGVLVFGSPRIRDPGDRSADAAFAAARDVFGRVGAICAERDLCLCIEPNPAAYGCRFVQTSAEARALIDAVGSPGFGLHLDAAGCHLAGEDPAAAVRASAGGIAHMHASEPQLGDFDAPVVDHAAVGAALREVGYDRWLSVEMRPQPVPAIDAALTHVRAAYVGGPGPGVGGLGASDA